MEITIEYLKQFTYNGEDNLDDSNAKRLFEQLSLADEQTKPLKEEIEELNQQMFDQHRELERFLVHQNSLHKCNEKLEKQVFELESSLSLSKKENDQLYGVITAIEKENETLKSDYKYVFNESLELTQKLENSKKENEELTISFKSCEDALINSVEQINNLKSRLNSTNNDLLDALDLKEGKGPTALMILKNELTSVKEQLQTTQMNYARILATQKETIEGLQESNTKLVEALECTNKLLELLSLHGGEIVSSASLDVQQIKQAQASGRMYVDNNSLGYVWMPNLTKLPETEEEVAFFEKWFPLDEPMPFELQQPEFLSRVLGECGGAKCQTPNCKVCKNEKY